MQLHSEILRRHSPFFNHKFDNTAEAKLRPSAVKNGIHLKWRFDLMDDNGENYGRSYDIGRLRYTPLDHDGRAIPGCPVASTNYSAGKFMGQIPDFYEKVLGTLYGRPILLETKENRIGDMLPEILGFMDVGEYLGCMHNIYSSLDNKLLEVGQGLWEVIAKNPEDWLDLGVRLHSYGITKEAAIHVVGKWYTYTDAEKAEFSHTLQSLLMEKAVWLGSLKKKTQVSLINYTPISIQRKLDGGLNQKNMQLTSYSHNIVDWMVTLFWTKWISIGVTYMDQGVTGPDGGFELMQGIYYERADRIMSAAEQDVFLTLHPLTARGKSTFNAGVEAFREQISKIVGPLMYNNLALDLSKGTFMRQFYTCVEFSREELACVTDKPVIQQLDWEVRATKSKRRGKKSVETKVKEMCEGPKNVKPFAEVVDVKIGDDGDDAKMQDEDGKE